MFCLKVTYWDPDPKWDENGMGCLNVFSSRIFTTQTTQSGVCLCHVLKAFVNKPGSLNTPTGGI